MIKNFNQEFELLEKLQENPEWTVNLVKNHQTQEKFIAKLSPTHDFSEEASLLKKINHSGFAQFIDSGFDEASQQYVFLRTYHPGKTLSQAKIQDLDEMLNLITSLSKSLFYLHQEGFVYLDLKPENIIWENHQSILFDLSLTQPFDRSLKTIPEGGSLAYMAPECFIGGHHLQQADFYSLGIILYEIMTGHLPFQEDSTEQIVLAHLFKDPAHPCLNHKTYPRQLGDLTLRLLQKNPTHRVEDGNDLIRLINQIFKKNFELEPVRKEFDQAEEQRIRSLDPKQFIEDSISFLEKISTKDPSHYQQLAELYFKNHKFEKLNEALNHLTPEEKVIYQTKTQIQMGHISEAEKTLMPLYQKLHELDHQQKGNYHNILGRIQYHHGNFDQSLNHFLMAWDSFNQNHDLESKMNTDLNLGNAAVAKQDWTKALQFYKRSLQEAEALKNPILEGRAYSNLGYLAQFQLDYHTAYHHYKKAYEIFMVLGLFEEQIQSGLNLGNLYLFFGSDLKAKEILSEIFELTQKIDHDYYQALCKLHQAEVYAMNEQHTQAEVTLLEGLDLISTLGTPQDRFHFYLSLVENQIRQDKLDQARGYFEKAKEDFNQAQINNFKPRLNWWKNVLDNLENQTYDQIEETLEGIKSSQDESYYIKSLFSLPKLYPQLDLKQFSHLFASENFESILKKIPEEFRDSFSKKINILNPDQTSLKEEKEVSNQIIHHGNFVEKLLYLNAELTEELNLDQLLEKIMDVLIDITSFERGFILLQENDNLEQVFSKNYENEPAEEKLISTSLAQTVFNRNKSIVTIDALNDERFSQTQSIHQLKLRSIVCLPFSFKGNVMGVVYLDSRLKKSVFEKNELNLLEPFCHQIAIAISNAKKFALQNQEIEILSQELKHSQKEISLKYSYENIIGSHPSMMRMFQLLDKITDSNIPVVIGGESGSGKEMVAKVIHYNGKRKEEPFLSINCAAMPENLLEAELFGSVKGSFTGSTQDKPGLFEIADKGSLFLDELGEMPLNMQAKLLRVLQEGEVRRIGGKKNIKVDVRMISATNKDLKQMISEKLFREDLYYRLVVASIKIPPLRERKNDIPLLIKYFLKQYSLKNSAPEKNISPLALKKLIHHDWPGNVRELENFVYQLCVFSEGDLIEVKDLSIKEEFDEAILNDHEDISAKIDDGTISLSDAKQEFEKREIKRILDKYHGHITNTAQHLQVLRPQLSRLIKKYDLKGDG